MHADRQAKLNQEGLSLVSHVFSSVASRFWVHFWACGFVAALFVSLNFLEALSGFGANGGAYQVAELAVTGLVVSLALCVLVLVTQKFHAKFSLDDDLGGVQKLHATPVPRVGGVPVFFSLFATLLWVTPEESLPFVVGLLIASLPVFAAGLIEDLTKKVSARQRLMWAMVSGLVACWVLGAVIRDLGFEAVNVLFSFTPIAVLFSAFAIAGMSNAINMIDGLNGLASGVVCLLALAFGLVAAQMGDAMLLAVCVGLAFSVLGFWLFNFPFGKIFLGDGGAYLMGVLLGVLAILLKTRSPQIDAWWILSILAYPVVEVLFSIYRRVKSKAAADQPDFAHFHQLVQRALVCKVKASGLQVPAGKLNSNATPFLWCFCLMSIALAFVGNAYGMPSMGFWVTGVVYIASYVWLARVVSEGECRGAMAVEEVTPEAVEQAA